MLESSSVAVFAPLDAVVGAAAAALDGIAVLLTPLAGGTAGAVAIVVFTVAVRLLISPLSYLQVRVARRRAALGPRLAELRERHAADPARLAGEFLAEQRRAGAGPLAGCLPALAQVPFFLVMYRLVAVPAAGVGPPPGELAGVPLTASLPGMIAELPVVFGVLLLLAAALAWWSSRRMRALAAAGTTGTPGPGNPVEAAVAAVGRLLPLLPYATVVLVAVLPLAAGLYLVTTGACTAVEQALWHRPPRADVAERG